MQFDRLLPFPTFSYARMLQLQWDTFSVDRVELEPHIARMTGLLQNLPWKLLPIQEGQAKLRKERSCVAMKDELARQEGNYPPTEYLYRSNSELSKT
eukprot:6428872-Amphidinium_carterae.1